MLYYNYEVITMNKDKGTMSWPVRIILLVLGIVMMVLGIIKIANNV